jgi:ribose 5-phosphate isomerase B
MSIFANRFSGIRAALCDNVKKAEMARLHNDSNIICLAADFIDKDEAIKCVNIWLETEFLGNKYQMRNEMIEKLSSCGC